MGLDSPHTEMPGKLSPEGKRLARGHPKSQSRVDPRATESQ